MCLRPPPGRHISVYESGSRDKECINTTKDEGNSMRITRQESYKNGTKKILNSQPIKEKHFSCLVKHIHNRTRIS